MPIFQPLPASEAAPALHVRTRTPTVFRAAAATWPAVKDWSFPYLASLDPGLPVQLVAGNRETARTRFTSSTLGSYIGSLTRDAPSDDALAYLKEFDLLKKFPQLRADLRSRELFPSGTIRSSATWIGPSRARTGLHCDLLDNLAVQIMGTKRFHLAHPGAVKRAGKESGKYDAWARLSLVGAEELAAGQEHGGFFVVDLEPGDVLYVPAYWWHEVVNLTPGVLLSGFFGPKTRVLSRWAWVQARECLHRAGLLGRGDCTCHDHSDSSAGRRSPGSA
ncbi:cupin-like domain-containing protein [Streptomyces coeruleorubidus]|uniref:cupin-like domain-containing protein n=1 Tax=Streptomyces coeruleorubidus TaxID=116188 RepID=UPI0033D8A1FF